VQPDDVVLPTPLASFDPVVGATLASLDAALAAIGERLEVPPGPYRPSEPASLLQVPRVVRRAALADAGDGFVIVYEAADAGQAADLAADLSAYLASGFGQTNYAADTQFAVSTLARTVIFTTWSAHSSDDPERARAVFEALGSVGQPVAVAK